MNKDNFEGVIRSGVGKAEEKAGEAFKDKSTSAQGAYDQVAGKAQQAFGSAKDAVAKGVEASASAASSGDMSEPIAK
jgi:uncharacterized protein YjbJ (UPF0337 family)